MALPRIHQLPGFPSCVHMDISFNDHAVMYQTVDHWVEDREDSGWLHWTDPNERAAALANDTVWTCQWYPETPVGFYVLAASTFEALMHGVRNALDEATGARVSKS